MEYEKFLRIPYKHQGKEYSGSDCFGLVYLFYRDELGIELPTPDFSYTENWWLQHDYFTELQKEYGFAPVSGPLRKGDILTFKNISAVAGHLGIVLNDSHFIHMSDAGCNITTYLMGPWHRQLHGKYRYVGRG